MMAEWKFVPAEAMVLREYPCGVTTGSRLRLRKQLVVRDHRGKPTGESHEAGEVWTVLSGNPDEPAVVWLREPNGKQHTWDDDDLMESFELFDETIQ